MSRNIPIPILAELLYEAEGISTRIQQRHFHPADIEADNITRIRLHIGCGELLDARGLLDRALDETHPQRIYRRLKLKIMSSLCHQAEAEPEAACQGLLGALQSSMGFPFVRIFLDEGEAVIQLLRQLKKLLNTSAPIPDKAGCREHYIIFPTEWECAQAGPSGLTTSRRVLGPAGHLTARDKLESAIPGWCATDQTRFQ